MAKPADTSPGDPTATVADPAETDKTFDVDGYKFGLRVDDNVVPAMRVTLVSPRGNDLDHFTSEKDAREAAKDPGSPARLAFNRHG